MEERDYDVATLLQPMLINPSLNVAELARDLATGDGQAKQKVQDLVALARALDDEAHKRPAA